LEKTRSLSIAKKLTQMNLLVSAGALAVACASLAAYDVGTSRQQIALNLSVQAQMAGSNSVSALLFNDPAAAVKTLSAFKFASNIVSAAIYTPERQLFADYRRDADGVVPPNPNIDDRAGEHRWFEHHDVMVVRSIVFQGKPIGYVYVESDLHSVTTRLTRYAIISVVVLMASLVAGLLISRVARESIAGPVTDLAETARSVSRNKNYSIRASAVGQLAELAVFVDAFNEMLNQIEERDLSLQAARDDLERRVEQRTAELAAANKELESFSYSVSHDLRAPLRSIDGFSLALLEDYADKLDEQGKHYLTRVREGAKRMGGLIDDLLNLSRMTRVEMRRERVDLTALARSIGIDLRAAEPSREVEFVVEDGLTANGDSHLLRAALDNLLRNAWKYTSKHPTARVEFRKQQSNGHVVFFVKDDGAGFDPQYSDRLFGAFQRLHGANEFPGTGVGLATVQRIIHRHGGKMWAEGAVEKGATFYFTL
jgi:signal transduction histidine kinase